MYDGHLRWNRIAAIIVKVNNYNLVISNAIKLYVFLEDTQNRVFFLMS